MKLKKVVSLALTGVMAVSMLAGCATKPATDGEGEGEGTTTGYSAEFAKYLDEDGVVSLDYVTFQDNASDLAALKDALGYFTDTQVAATQPFTWAAPATYGKAIDDFSENADVTETASYGLNVTNIFPLNSEMNQTVKAATAWVADGTMDINKALKEAASRFDSAVVKADLPKSGSAGGTTYNYHYVVSVSVANRGTTTFDQVHPSANVIVLTITRTGTAA